MSGTKGLTRQQMADRVALEFQEGWIVNLGVGIPTQCSNTDIGDRHIIYHSENGVIGYGPIAPAGEEDLNLVNAGGQNVTLNPGAAVVHHADSFGIIRGGRIDVTVMGAYEVACNGDFANWKVSGPEGRRHRRRDGSRGMRETGVHHPGARDARRRTAAGATVRAAGDGARRGEAGRDELRVVRADGRRVPAARDRAGIYRRGSARSDRRNVDRAR